MLEWILGTLLFLMFALVISWFVARPRHLVVALRCAGELIVYAGTVAVDASATLNVGFDSIALEWRARRAADRSGLIVGVDVTTASTAMMFERIKGHIRRDAESRL